jgi:hypothetical protein
MQEDNVIYYKPLLIKQYFLKNIIEIFKNKKDIEQNVVKDDSNKSENVTKAKNDILD